MLNRKRELKKKFAWTKKRLRTENRLLRQRIDYLEAESSALADRLVKGQVNLAQESEHCISIAHELNILRDINSDAHRKLEDAYDSIRLFNSNGKSRKKNKIRVDDTSMIEHIHSLQQELIERHNKQADAENTIRELKQRVTELEAANKRLREHEPSEGIAGLQEELISVKMREAEAALSLKEIRQRLAELEQHWAKYIHMRTFDPTVSVGTSGDAAHPTNHSDAPMSPSQQSFPPLQLTSARAKLAKITATIMGSATEEDHINGAITLRELEDQLMGVRIKEADTVAELKEMRQKVMELETQNRVCMNQLKRQDDELRRLREEKETFNKKERDFEEGMNRQKANAVQRESELTEQCMLQRIKYSEAMQSISDLRQTIAQLELKKAEKWTERQLRGVSVGDDDDSSLQNISMNGSHHSVSSSQSIASEDMHAILSELTVKVPTGIEKGRCLPLENGLCSMEEEEGSATETEDRDRGCLKIARCSNNAEEDGNDTTDSGIKC